MKLKSLLLFGASMFVTTSAFAAWEKPTAKGSELQSGEKYYIMNVEAGKYMTGMVTTHSWATTCGLSDNGQLSTITFDDAQGAWTIQREDGKYTFMSGQDECHVDMGSQGHNYFDITSVGNNNYTIAIAAGDDTYGVDVTGAVQYWGYQKDAAVPAHIYCNSSAENAAINWIFVTEEEAASIAPKMEIYNTALKLEKAINDAKAEYPTIDLVAEENVYNNTGSTLEELQAAINGVAEKVKAAAEASASVANPINMTSKIINPTFDTIGNFTGWSGTAFGAGGTTSTCAEQFQKVFDSYQDIKNMPNGVYKVTVDGMYRAGGAAEDYVAEKTNTINNTKLYGMNLVEDATKRDVAYTNVFHQFHGIEPGEHFDISGNSLGGQENTFDGETYWVPNSMKDFTNYNGTTAEVANPYYKGCGVLFPVSEGNVRIGVKNDTTVGWSIFDNFGLTYYGNGADAWTALMDDTKSNQAIEAGALVTVSVKKAFEDVVAASSATDYPSYVAAVASIAEAKTIVDENMAAWKSYQELAEKAEKLVQDPKYMEVAIDLADYLTYDYPEFIQKLELSTEQLKAEIEVLQALYDETKELTPPGTDVTSMIENPDFANSWTGWSHTGTGGNVAANAAAKCAEAWNSANFDIHQDIENAPVGVYEVQVQGFYRYLRDENAWLQYFNEDGTKKTVGVSEYITNTPAKIFINDSENPMANVFDYSMSPEWAAENWTAGNYYTDPNGEKCYPNNMADAGKAFDEGQYMVSAVGLVAKKGDALRIGMKGNSNQGGDSWAIFTRFKLIYQGFDVNVIKPALEKALKTINTDALMGSDVIEEANKAVQDGKAALEQTEGKKMFDALAEIYAVQSKVETSTALFSKLIADVENFTEVLGNSEEARPAVVKEASDLSKEITNAIEAKTYTDAQATEAIEKMAKYIKLLSVPASIDEASDDNPVEISGVITNNSFEEGTLNGWTVAEGTADTGAKENSNSTYTISNAVGNYVFNTWSGSAVEGGFFLAQDIEELNLPAGTYELKCLVASDADNMQIVSANEYETEVVTTGKGTAEEVSLFFKIENDNDKISIKVASQTWFKADEFLLFYYGKNSTGIENVIVNNNCGALEIYTLNGMKVNTLQKGINIVRTANGVKKILK